VEHYFQSEKFRGYPSEQAEEMRLAVIGAPDADSCKKLARSYQVKDKEQGVKQEHWKQWDEERKDGVMRKAIALKFE
jgi:predicted NAD-dependent protein-ADP-ribosyltransferase YbiA (DUF1768 family)